jgi:hypothetical protein
MTPRSVFRIAGLLFAAAALAPPAAALAQEPRPAAPDRPRVELGAGGSVFFSGGTMPYSAGMIDTRIGVRVSRNWSLEGLVHFMPSDGSGALGYYRAQALWRLGCGRFRPFVAFGGAGEYSRYRWPEFQWVDYSTGEVHVTGAGSAFDITAPMYPTASVGIERIVLPHLAVRAELTAAFGINEYGIAVAMVPAVSVSVPIGRYVAAAR